VACRDITLNRPQPLPSTPQLPSHIQHDAVHRAVSSEQTRAVLFYFYTLEPQLYKSLSAAGLCLNHIS